MGKYSNSQPKTEVLPCFEKKAMPKQPPGVMANTVPPHKTNPNPPKRRIGLVPKGNLAKVVLFGPVPKGFHKKVKQKRRSDYAREFFVERHETCQYCKYEGCILGRIKASLKNEGDRLQEKRPNGKPKVWMTMHEIKQCVESSARFTIKAKYTPVLAKRGKSPLPVCVQRWINENYS